MSKEKDLTKIETHNSFIDVIKGLCIVFIIVTHFSWTNEELLKWLFPFWIDMAVPIFMIVSGYVYALSYIRNEINSISDAYLIRNIASKMIRYTFPFIIFFAIEEIYFLSTGQLTVSWSQFFVECVTFLCGGVGPGSYYYPVMMQFIFIFPLIYFIVRKYQQKGLMICGLINAIYEVLQNAYGMNATCYRLLAFRYILVIAAGCFIALNKEKKINIRLAISSCITGIVFIIFVCYLGYVPKIIIYWTRTSFIACLYIIPIVMVCINQFSSVRFRLLEILGKASYNIFFAQMLWFTVAAKYVSSENNRFIHLLVSLIVSLGSGVVFYFIETPITSRINNIVNQLLSKRIQYLDSKCKTGL